MIGASLEVARRTLHLVLLTAGVAIGLYFLWLLRPGASGSTPFTCNPNDMLEPPFHTSILFIGTGVVAFLFGNLLSQHWAGLTALRQRDELLFGFAVVAFLGLVAWLLGYETFATWWTGLYPDPPYHPSNSYLPITSYVRCGINKYPHCALGATVLVPYLVGRWLQRGP